MKKGWLAPLMALALCCASCAPQMETFQGEAISGSTADWIDAPAPILNMPNQQEPDTAANEEEPEEKPGFPEVLTWTTEPVLDSAQMPDDHNGLELPVQGAIGYASIQLPMWRSVEDSAAARSAVEEWQRAQAEAQRLREEEEARRLEAARLEAEARQAEEERQRQAARASQATAAVGVTSSGQAPVLGPIPTEPDASGNDMPAEDGAAVDNAGVEGTTPKGEGSGTEPVAVEPQDPAAPEASPKEPVTQNPAGSEVQPPAAEEPAAPEPAVTEPETAQPEVVEKGPTLTDGAMAILPAGTPFTILQEAGDWWKIRCEVDYTDTDGQKKHGEAIGWVEHHWCMINLPDVIPSILYDATNGYASKFVSCGKPLEGITGQALYAGKTPNARLGEEEFMAPVLYSMAFRLCAAQRTALSQGNCIVLYEGYRPLDVQLKVSGVLRVMIRDDAEVRAGVTSAPWNISWFIATSASNHQHGYAVDMSLARVGSVRECLSGTYRYIRVETSKLYDMPTAMHELSRAAATFTTPVSSNSETAWRSAVLAPTMNEPAIGMQRYCTDAGLTPLASEWWHFNDLTTRAGVLSNLGNGDFFITRCRSIAP